MSERLVARRAFFASLISLAGETVRGTHATPSTKPRIAANEQVVQLRPSACLAFRGTLCTVCVERCPVPGAIVLDRGRPKIVESLCTGCGDCVARCPAPINALALRPR